MSKILVVEDDIAVCTTLVDLLEMEKYVVESVNTGTEGLDRIQFYSYNLLILDWGLPGITGVEICKKYRAAGGKSPILFLTGRDDVADKEKGFEAGVDDYLTKPFSPNELMARVRALLRRNSVEEQKELSYGAIKLRPSTFRIAIGEQEIELLPREFTLLEFLMKQPEEVFSAEVLLNRVWPSETEGTPQALRTCIKRLRKKIEVPGSGCVIGSVYGMGYKLQLATNGDASSDIDGDSGAEDAEEN